MLLHDKRVESGEGLNILVNVNERRLGVFGISLINDRLTARSQIVPSPS